MVVVYLVITSGMFPVVDSVAVLAHTVVAMAPFAFHGKNGRSGWSDSNEHHSSPNRRSSGQNPPLSLR